jgi:multidrug efflux pump subunit AcrB
MTRRPLIALVALGVILSAVPLYKVIRQDYLPSGVDEGEFNVFVTGPQEMSLAATDEALQRIEADIRSIPGVRTVLASAGGGFLGSVNVFHGRVEAGRAHFGPLSVEYPDHADETARPAQGFARPHDLDLSNPAVGSVAAHHRRQGGTATGSGAAGPVLLG